MSEERQQLHQAVVAEFRANGGQVGGQFAGIPLLLLTTTGARTGEQRTWPLTYVRFGQGYVIAAANGGRPTLPGWFHNVVANPRARIEVGTRTIEVTARVATDAERAELWDEVVAQRPLLGEIQQATDRAIALVITEPI